MTAPAIQVRKEAENKFTVRATWPDGTFEEMPGFTSEREADDWITNKFPFGWKNKKRRARVEK
jgi:hypothetical protein